MPSDIIVETAPPQATAAPTAPNEQIPPLWRLWNKLTSAARAIGVAIVSVYLHFARPIGFQEVLLFAGAILVGVGLSFVSLPIALIVPGAVLLYVAIAGVK